MGVTFVTVVTGAYSKYGYSEVIVYQKFSRDLNYAYIVNKL